MKDRTTVRFDDIGEAPILWCSSCGPRAQAMDAALTKAFNTRPDFAVDFEAAVVEAEQENRRGAS